MKIGILTGGGDCPGLNAVIRAVVRKGVREGDAILGIFHGWQGMLTGQHEELTQRSVSGLIHLGGTILHTSRTNPFAEDGGSEKVIANFKRLGLDGLIAIGGEDTLGVANKFFKIGLPVVGVPKTIDNDLSGTDFTFGFQTAVQTATDAIDRLVTTAESHDRVMVVEVMGRHTGWIAVYSGMAGGADVILIPEQPFDIEAVCDRIVHRHRLGANFSIVVVAEGAPPVEVFSRVKCPSVVKLGELSEPAVGAMPTV